MRDEQDRSQPEHETVIASEHFDVLVCSPSCAIKAEYDPVVNWRRYKLPDLGTLPVPARVALGRAVCDQCGCNLYEPRG